MIIFGHRFIPGISLYHVSDIDSIQNTPPSSTLYVPFCEENLDIINHAKENDITLALSVENINEIIYSSSLEASYIIVSRELASKAQNIANNYLFDAKILVSIEEEQEIQEMALLGVDGVIFSNAIVKINS
ncbi:hypothetical protein KKG72_09755 [bacterium]|nr:hypothetical protein [bacterium]MBU1993863.1 hypothetical protein [bacterium]